MMGHVNTWRTRGETETETETEIETGKEKKKEKEKREMLTGNLTIIRRRMNGY